MAPPSIVILTGAGISKESGLDTFRHADGIWARVRLEDVATPEAFARDPARVHEFYNHRRARLLEAEIAPNAAHLALARLEREWPGESLLVTQNVDNLHERAGSTRLLHMHGALLKSRCTHCRTTAACSVDLSVADLCPACGRGGGMRPDIVWFGEMPMHMDEIARALDEADLFVSIGTSGNVYPAAGFAQEARAAGARCVELNLEPSAGISVFHEAIYGPASKIVPAFVARLLAAA
jgi:NAD-dependent deacetylase